MSGIKKLAALLTLVAQNSALALFMRYTRAGGAVYAATTAVVLAEVLKAGVSMVLLCLDLGIGGMLADLKANILQKPASMIKMSVPAGLYCVQNNLAYIAVTNLDGPTYQLLYQLKILTTAMFSVAMLNRTLSKPQWFSLLGLTLGVGMVQLSSISAGAKAGESESNVVGFVAVLAACMTSGFAGVFFEKVLKESKVSLWTRNIQLAIYGILVGLMGIYTVGDAEAVMQNGFTSGYTWAVWMCVILNSAGGLLVAVVVKYTDNVAKGFATSISILCTCAVSYALFSFVVTQTFVLGGAFVLASTYIYGVNPPGKLIGESNSPMPTPLESTSSDKISSLEGQVVAPSPSNGLMNRNK